MYICCIYAEVTTKNDWQIMPGMGGAEVNVMKIHISLHTTSIKCFNINITSYVTHIQQQLVM